MSKTLSLDTKTIYQSGIILTGLLCLVIIVMTTLQGIKLLDQPKTDSTVKIREQQLKNSLKLINSIPSD